MTKASRYAIAGFAVAMAVMAASLELTNTAPQAPPPGIPTAGYLVEWTLPAALIISMLAAMATIGLLLAAVFFLPSGPELEGLSVRAVVLAGRWAVVWALATLASLVLSTADTMARPLGDTSVALLWSFITDFAPGLTLAFEVLVAAYVAVICRWTLAPRVHAITIGVSLAAVVLPPMAGHASSAGAHALAVPALLLHSGGAALWIGGLIGLGWVALRGSKRLEAGVSRYSVLALWCFITVGISGVISAATRLGSWHNVDSVYGALSLFKVGLFLVLGLFGIVQRRRLAGRKINFAVLAVSELFVMMAAVAVGIVLSRSQSPLGDDVLTTAGDRLLGSHLPPAPTLSRVFLGFYADGLGIALVTFAALLYIVGIRAMYRRGDTWPVGRTISWFVGVVILAWATFGGLGWYAPVMFSYHMGSHMAMAMVVPIFLVLGAPVTLALRTLPGPRRPGENSPRSMLLWLLHSWVGRFYTNPFVAAFLFVGSLYVVYFTNLFELLMQSHWGHMFMQVHFLTSGFLFFYVIIGVDPSPRRLHPLVRMLILMVTIPIHSFFGMALMMRSTPIGQQYFDVLNRSYDTNLMSDQYFAAGLTWGVTEIPTLIVVIVLIAQWWSADKREATRSDRAASNDDDAELERYNAYLASLRTKSDHQW
jgi:cytochrome c oxidase assembly factor CtaG/putative copper export protein